MFHKLKNMFFKKDPNLGLLVNDEALLVDVRSPLEFSSGNVAGSVNIPVDQIHNHLDKFRNKKNIIVFCRSGMRSSQAKAILERNGIKNVTNGGTWQNVESLVTNKNKKS